MSSQKSSFLTKISFHYSYVLFIIILLFLGKYFEILIITISIILHELSHVLFFSLFQGKKWRIKLFMFGGIAYLGEYHETTVSRIIVTLSGPLLNFIIAGLFYFFSKDTFILKDIIIKYNLIMGIFCLLPIYPLDGYNLIKHLNKFSLRIISLLFLGLFALSSFITKSLGLFIIFLFLLKNNLLFMKKEERKNKLRKIINVCCYQ